MAIVSAYAVPHPPIIVPGVGKGEEKGLVTIESYRRIARMIAEKAPETIVLITPHAELYADYIHIAPGDAAEGSLARFGAPKKVRAAYDRALTAAIGRVCAANGFPAGTLGEKMPRLDHGTLVPLHFINEAYTDYRLVRVSASGLSRGEHYRFGQLLREAVEDLPRRVAVVASGDLSHKLKADGPYGFVPEGPKLDEAICAALAGGDFGGLFRLDEAVCEAGAECGLAGLLMMAGALDRTAVDARLWSYEGTLGVGYAVASFDVIGPDSARDFLDQAERRETEAAAARRAGEDAFVRLARASIEHYTRMRRPMKTPEGLDAALTGARAGAFVSIKKNGRLRGCIGTTEPTRATLAAEIIENAISACARDPRFPPVTEDELPLLTISVDVLLPAEPAERDELDPKRYGVIVSRGHRRGLLLPDLEGVDTVEEQLEIACQKAGIDPAGRYDIERFEVVRHT